MSEKTGAVLDQEVDASAEYDKVVSDIEEFAKANGAKYDEDDDGDMKPDDMTYDEDDEEAMKKMKGHKDKEPSEEFMKMAKKYGYSKGGTMAKSVDADADDSGIDHEGGDSQPSNVDGVEVIAGFERTLAKSIAGISKAHDQSSRLFAKTLKAVMGQVGALQKEVEALGNGPQPRKSQLDILSKSVPGDQVKDGPSADEILAKAVEASADGRITPSDVSQTRMYLQSGEGQVPAGLLKQIMGN